MLVFRRKRAPPGPTQLPCPVPLAALRTPPAHMRCIATTYAGRRRRTDGGRDASLSQSPDGRRLGGEAPRLLRWTSRASDGLAGGVSGALEKTRAPSMG